MAMENGIMPVMDVNGNDYGGSSWWWIIIIFVLLGFGNNNNAVTPTQLQNGFDTNEILSKLNAIGNGIADGFYTTNTGMLNGFASTREAIGQARFDTLSQTGEINNGINSLKYDNAMQTQAIMKNDCDNTQKILDAITGNRMAEMQNRINQLELTATLGNVVRYPSATTYTAGYSPCFRSCGE